MNIARSDIKLRFGDNGNVTVWIAQRAIVEYCGVSDDYSRRIKSDYKQSLSASWRKVLDNQEYFLGDSGKAWRYGYKDGRFWYDYDRVPNRAPNFYRSLLPSKDEIVEFMREAGGNIMGREREVQLREDVLEQVAELVDVDDVDYYQYYPHEVTGKRIYNISTATELGQSVAWIMWIKESIKTNRFQELGFRTIKDFYGWVASEVSKCRLKGLEVTTARSLRNKVSIMPDERSQIRRMLVCGKYCNQNAAILGKKRVFVNEETGEIKEIAVHDTIMLGYWMNFGQPGKGIKTELYKKYHADLLEMGERPVSLSLFSKFLATPLVKDMTAAARHGIEYYKKMISTYVPSRKLEFANSLWCGDASGTISYRYYGRDGKCKMRKLYTILISDVATGYIVGHTVGKAKVSSENFHTMREAVANAVSNPLNEKRQVLEFLSDNHGAYTGAEAKEYLRSVAKKVRTIEAHNSQANPAERMFRVFKQSLRGLYNLYETSFGAKNIENVANEDYFTVEMLPTFDEAVKQLAVIIENFNSRVLPDGTTPKERFIHLKNPQCGVYREQSYRMITQKGHAVDLTRSRGILEVMSDGDKVRYELPVDVQTKALIAKYTKYKTEIAVTLYADGERADIYDEDGNYIMTVDRVREACISTSEAKTEERIALKHHEKRKQQQLDDVVDFEYEVIENLSFIRGGDRFGIDMKTSKYRDFKKEYNEKREEAINIAVGGRVKVEKAEMRATAKAERIREQHEDDSYMEMIRKKVQINNQKNI